MLVVGGGASGWSSNRGGGGSGRLETMNQTLNPGEVIDVTVAQTSGGASNFGTYLTAAGGNYNGFGFPGGDGGSGGGAGSGSSTTPGGAGGSNGADGNGVGGYP